MLEKCTRYAYLFLVFLTISSIYIETAIIINPPSNLIE